MLKQFEVQNIYIGEYVKPTTFTISWTETSNPASFNPVYSDDAAWLTAWSTAFDDFFWYYGCRLSNAGVETAKQSQSAWVLDITQLGTLTSWDNVMIAFPRRWIKMSKSWSTVTLSITDAPNADWYQYYAHTKGSADKDTLYLWAYKMVSWYQSLSWKAPIINQTRRSFRYGVKNAYDSSAWTDRYSIITIYPRWYINALYMMKYGNPNSQSVIWQWNEWTNSTVKNTGWTNSQTSATYWTTSNTVQVKLFWLEDWWGNVEEWIDWCFFNSSSELTVDKTNSIFQDSNYSTNIWSSSNWYMTAIWGGNDNMFICTSAGWSNSTYYADRFDKYANGCLIGWGRCAMSSSLLGWAWVFRIQAQTYDYYNSYIGSRLMYL